MGGWEGGVEILALMNYGICGYIHLCKIKIVLSTSLTHTLLSSPQPTGWFIVTKITMIPAQITYNLSYEYKNFTALCVPGTFSKLSPPLFNLCVCVCVRVHAAWYISAG